MQNKKTYSEASGEEPFNWNIALAKHCREINLEDSNKLKELASSWVTCACGNQCDVIPRYGDTGRPKDERLSILGERFHHRAIYPMCREIEHSNFETADRYRLIAIDILKEIEERSLGIIIEME